MAASCPQKVQQRALAFSTTRVATCCALTKTWCATALITVAMSLTRVPPWTVPCQVSLHNLSSLLIHHRSREASIGALHALSFEGKFTCHRHDAEKRRLLVVCWRILNSCYTSPQTIFRSRSQEWGCGVECEVWCWRQAMLPFSDMYGGQSDAVLPVTWHCPRIIPIDWSCMLICLLPFSRLKHLNILQTGLTYEQFISLG